MKILALDLGTKTGWAHFGWKFDKGFPVDQQITSGTWVLATPAEVEAQGGANLDRCCDMRPARLQERLFEIPVDWIYFEDVQFLTTQLQAQLWASLRAVIQLSPLARCGRVRAVPVGTLKKFATGHGNATKEQMGEALLKVDSRFYVGRTRRGKVTLFESGNPARPVDDNEVDALHLLRFALQELHANHASN